VKESEARRGKTRQESERTLLPLLAATRAALLFARLLLVLHRVEDFQQRRLHSLLLEARRGGTGGTTHRKLNIGRRARAALRLFASRALALQFALGLLAIGRLDTLVLAIQFLAHRAAFGFGSRASRVALSRVAHGFTLGARILLAVVLGATDTAHWALAMHGTLGASHFFTSHLTLRTRAHRVAHSRTTRIVALPLALRVALLSRDSDSEG